MQRISITPRPDWQANASDIGFNWHTPGRPYWDESAYYSLTDADAGGLFEATREAYAMLLETIGRVIERRELIFYGYNPDQIALIEKSWSDSDQQPSLYGRFNIAMTAEGPKVISFNGDNPSGLLEASIMQRQWLDATYPGGNQFNGIHDRLFDMFQRIAGESRTRVMTDTERRRGSLVHVTCMPEPDQQGVADYLGNIANEAGVDARFLLLTDVGLSEDDYSEHFVDGDGQSITTMLKLCPLAWMLNDQFGPKLIDEAMNNRLRLIEPAWKMLASNNRLFVDMWDGNAYHPLLVHSATSPQAQWFESVAKPLNGHGGQNIVIRDIAGQVIDQTGGGYAGSEVMYQERVVPLGDHAPIIASWIVGGEPCGVSIREASKLIVDEDSARFLPHAVDA
jgi:glutathionylspermidine synthase